MHQPADQSGSPGDGSSLGWESASLGSFAGMLASLSTPAQKRDPAWNDGLADDVATLSYERALQTHARYHSTDRSDRSLTQAPDPQPMLFDESDLKAAAPPTTTAAGNAASFFKSGSGSAVGHGSSPALDKNLKRSSITIRLSRAERDQVHQRAAEAGLTVSAYLRSCTLEVESLRALVKETLAQLQAAQVTGKPSPSAQTGPARLGWLGKILPYGERGHRGQGTMRA